MANLEKLVEELSALTVLEAAELSKLLETKWGVSAAAPVAVAAAGGAAAAPAEVKDEFTVVLAAAGECRCGCDGPNPDADRRAIRRRPGPMPSSWALPAFAAWSAWRRRSPFR